jgi:hypothetical protein
LRARPALGEPAFDKQLIDPDFGCFHRQGA